MKSRKSNREFHMRLKHLMAGVSLASAMAMSPAFAQSTLVYCSEGSPEGFDPALYTAGTTFDASVAASTEAVTWKRDSAVLSALGKRHRCCRSGSDCSGRTSCPASPGRMRVPSDTEINGISSMLDSRIADRVL